MTFSLPSHALDRDLVLDFFWKFSVFECALKREGFLRAGRNKGAEPDWDRFGSEVRGRFAEVADPGFGEAVRKLKALSPKRQVVRDRIYRGGCARPRHPAYGARDSRWLLRTPQRREGEDRRGGITPV